MKKILMKNSVYIKMVNKCYQNHKENIEKRQKKTQDRYQEEEEKEEKCQYHRQRNKNLSKEEKEKKVEFMKNYYLAHKK